MTPGDSPSQRYWPRPVLSDALGIVAQRLVRRVCLTVQNPIRPAGGFKGAWSGWSADSTRGMAAGSRKSVFQFWLPRAGSAGSFDIDDTVREIIYEGTMTQLHRYLGKSILLLFSCGGD